jgi:DNA polymerase (family X)
MSPSATIPDPPSKRGIVPYWLKEQFGGIWSINNKMKTCRILAGTEIDIRADGTPDFPDELLKEPDFVVVSVHFGLRNGS